MICMLTSPGPLPISLLQPQVSAHYSKDAGHSPPQDLSRAMQFHLPGSLFHCFPSFTWSFLLTLQVSAQAAIPQEGIA